MVEVLKHAVPVFFFFIGVVIALGVSLILERYRR
jgi:hypothetical protein